MKFQLPNLSESDLVRLVSAIYRIQYPEIDLLHEQRLGHQSRPDLLALGENPQIIELARITPQTRHRIKDRIDQLLRYREAFREKYPDLPSPQLVMVTPETLTSRYIDQLAEQEITVLDGTWLETVLSNHPYIADHFLARHSFDPEQPSDIAETLLARLNSVRCGRTEWYAYQKLCAEILEFLFFPPLERPILEVRNETKTNRRDIVIPNYCNSGFFHFLRVHYRADYIVADAKNYCKSIGKDEVLQLVNYLTEKGPGLFGIVISRNEPDSTAVMVRREQWVLDGKMIIFLTDVDMTQMITSKRHGGDPSTVIRQKIEDFRLAI
ncbi:hypothetical protein GT755_11920 [Herbidospora sp. NEAU-GS84]|uniref:Restriction endonuclease type IV Mrr domain-containing protein n=1 Tax=Herbidospora solisilvae TaxID=2696284 RepID=A0A7C9N0P6_9ACTN|nr:hypothetical protein [Herbidospora solisilvae]NAS22389.1 hypothetical protein [Herbidospora solisilvae]